MTAPDLAPVDLFDVESRLPEEPRLAHRSVARFQVHLGTKDVVADGVRILPFVTFCREAGIP